MTAIIHKAVAPEFKRCVLEKRPIKVLEPKLGNHIKQHFDLQTHKSNPSPFKLLWEIDTTNHPDESLRSPIQFLRHHISIYGSKIKYSMNFRYLGGILSMFGSPGIISSRSTHNNLSMLNTIGDQLLSLHCDYTGDSSV
eukprot:294694_1